LFGASFAAVAVAFVCVISFATVLVLTKALSPLKTIYQASVTGVTSMLDPELSEEVKETAVQRAAIALIYQSAQVAWRFMIALLSAWAAILAADRLGLASESQVLDVLLRVDFILVVSVVAIGLSWLLRQSTYKGGQPAEGIADSDNYGGGDKIVHAIAFASPSVQIGLANFEDRIFQRTLEAVECAPPVFITSLARGGTTALLNSMSEHPQFATHRYSDMPFLTAPMLWSRLAGRRAHGVERERAHGDGIKIGLQSPEAFDEVLWMLQSPEKYHDLRIDVWASEDIRPGYGKLFDNHFRKILVLRRPEVLEGKLQNVRYLSKNNANIARLRVLSEVFPGCRIILALREPSAHAESLYRQHVRFSDLHLRDAFTMRYMRDIGHFEFGELHRPIAFDSDFVNQFDPAQPNYWLAYWISAFEEACKYTNDLLVVDHADIRGRASTTMRKLFAHIGVPDAPGGAK
jgi:hypothetical protein